MTTQPNNAAMYTSELPNLYNESVFRLLMDYEIKRSQRYISPVTLLRIAIVTPNPSAPELELGPSVLAGLLNSRLRAADLPARIGSEYAVLLPTTDTAGGRAVCERFISATAGTHTTLRGYSIRLAICIGMTSHPGGPTLAAEPLLQEAEAALAKARSRGPQNYLVYADMT